MANNRRKEVNGITVKVSELLSAKKEAISALESQIQYEERNIKDYETSLIEENEKPEEQRYDWRIEEFNRQITESKLKIVFFNEAIGAILDY